MPAHPARTTSPRAPRSDALRNDVVVMDAARAVFAEQGPQASMEAIASRAGLGVGTIYRRFPGKDALLDAIAELFARELDDAAADALTNSDPGAGLEQFLDFVGTFNAEKSRYASVLTDRSPLPDVSARTEANVWELTRNAVAAGALAPHVTGTDIKALIVALRGIIVASTDTDPEWRRFVAIHLAGLRA